jgi:hypothetical protein
MASATSVPLRVRKVERRPASRFLSSISRVAMRVCGVAVIGALTVGAVMTGTWWLISLSLKAGTDIRTALVLRAPAEQGDWQRVRDAQSQAPAFAASQPAGAPLQEANLVMTPEDANPAAADAPAVTEPASAPVAVIPLPVPAPIRSAARKSPPSPADDVTGAIGTTQLAYASLDTALPAPATAPSLPAVGEAAASLPVPRARPQQLASLGPVDRLGISPADDSATARTAIYDIKAQAVYLPSGERLEAHSGLGSLMDDPRHVRVKNRGPTPPNSYKLKLRETLFHGVQAIRLTPENESKMFGRDGILAHTYMLGPNGQSNGCVSFRDYHKFLRAYLRGEIDRMVVVPSLPEPPRFFARSRKPRHDQAALTQPAT